MKRFPCAIIFIFLWSSVKSDLPVNCTVDDVQGEWLLFEGPPSNDPNMDCSTVPDIERRLRVVLGDGLAYGDGSQEGTWTMIYNQGFEIRLQYRTYFAFFKYENDELQDSSIVTSLCNETFIGKSHDVTLRHWACFFAEKTSSVSPKRHIDPFGELGFATSRIPRPEEHQDLVDRTNEKQSSWRAELHSDFLNKSSAYLLNLRGGKRSWLPQRVESAGANDIGAFDSTYMLRELDWRNVNGTNYVSPIRDQGNCGSCYAFSSAGMIEARLRILTNNKLQPILSPQDIVDCTTLSQGCQGGFPYLIAGKYGWEKGLTEEKCNPYSGKSHMCSTKTCYRWYTAKYEYVGGHYGACSEKGMMKALLNGPLSVSFEVHPDFMHYKSGIYHYTGVKGLEPFVTVNHAVLLVGYGVDEATKEKYWIVKNSWGEGWGEDGYFRIRRGVDECGIESAGVEAFPIPY